MSSPPNSPGNPPASGLPLSPIGPLLLWLILQLLLLCLPVFQIPLSDQYPRPAEKLALGQLILGHLIFSSLFFPFLFRGWSAGILLTVSTWPFIQIAASLSSASGRMALVLGSYVSLWLSALTLWGATLSERRGRHALATFFSLLTLMGPALWYLHAEYGNASNAGLMSVLNVVSPSLSALQLARTPSLAPFALPLVLLLLPLALRFLRQVFPKLSTAASAEKSG